MPQHSLLWSSLLCASVSLAKRVVTLLVIWSGYFLTVPNMDVQDRRDEKNGVGLIQLILRILYINVKILDFGSGYAGSKE